MAIGWMYNHLPVTVTTAWNSGVIGLGWLTGTAFDWSRAFTKTRPKWLWSPLQAQLLPMWVVAVLMGCRTRFALRLFPYMVRQRNISQTCNDRLASSIIITLSVCKMLWELPKFYSLKSRRVIKTRWPLVECITTSPSQWINSAIWLVPGGCPELVSIGRDQLLKTTTLVATASTSNVTSNVSSSCAYRTMVIHICLQLKEYYGTLLWERYPK